MPPRILLECPNAALEAELQLVLGDSRCKRCDGLMVHEHCSDLFDDTGKMAFPALRCVQCGEVVDAIILLNRLRFRGSDTRQPTKRVMNHWKSRRMH